jgi:hypothetical protein
MTDTNSPSDTGHGSAVPLVGLGQPAHQPNGTGGAPVSALTPEAARNGMPINARDLKAHIFSSHNPRNQFRREIINFFGSDIELRQPSLDMIAEMTRATSTGDTSDNTAAIFILTNYVYVPGTSERVFDVADTDQLKALPYNEDFQKLNEVFVKITGVNVEAERKNS